MTKLKELNNKALAKEIETYLTRKLAEKGYITLMYSRTSKHLTKICRKYNYWGWCYPYGIISDINKVMDNIEILDDDTPFVLH